jgi:hypothetical protein
VSESTGAGEWDRLLDRLEQRLRLIDQAAGPRPAGPVDIGPPAVDADLPREPPSTGERLRLLALLAEHGRLIERLESKRRSLRQAQYYQIASG